MDESLRKQLTPGALVEVTQQIARREQDRAWANTVRGTIVSYEQRQTGSWFAHARADKLWLDRLMVRKEDGEITVLNLDDYSVVRILSPAGGEGHAQPAVARETAK
jgi:hypothetical protein